MAEKQQKEDKQSNKDAILEIIAKNELESALKWEAKWGFLRKESDEINNQLKSGSWIPSKQERLISDMSWFTDPKNDFAFESMTLEQKKQFYLHHHKIKEYQKVAGAPKDKYSFPPTRSAELGWWMSFSDQ